MTIGMHQKEALKEWKKAKPVLLTNTGVSELLRKLPLDPIKLVDLELLKEIADDLDDKISDTKIKTEKKAVAALKHIQEEIRDDIEWVKDTRSKAIQVMQEIHAAAFGYYKAVKLSDKLTVQDVTGFQKLVSGYQNKIDRLLNRGRDSSAVDARLMHEYQDHLDSMISISKFLVILLEDSKSAKPKHDLAKVYPAERKRFEKEMDMLPPIWKKAEK